jgi:hypothetical protein
MFNRESASSSSATLTILEMANSARSKWFHFFLNHFFIHSIFRTLCYNQLTSNK